MEAVIGIIDESSGYAKHLASYINSRRDVGYKGIVFTKDSEIQDYLKSNNLSFLLSDNPEHIIVFGKLTKVYLLSDNRIENEALEEDSSQVFKYQKASSIISAILPKSYEKQNNEQIHVVYSPNSNEEGFIFATHFAESLGETGKTLFIPWEPFGTSKMLEKRMGTGLSEIMFSVRQGGRGLKKNMLGLPQKKGVYFVEPASFYYDFWEFGADETEKLCKLLLNLGEFKYIVFCCGIMTGASERLMENAGNVWLVRKKDGDERAEEFLRQMKKAGKQKILSSIKEVKND